MQERAACDRKISAIPTAIVTGPSDSFTYQWKIQVDPFKSAKLVHLS